jgi:thiol-disulfide isomerase/thioredoxin
MRYFVLRTFAGLVTLAALVGCIRAAQPIPMNIAAPELVGGGWINTEGGRPIQLGSRHGKVTVVEFWTFGCINCRHNLPSYARWYRQFGREDVAIIGVHTPETDEERNAANVKAAVKQLGIEYPVLVDDQSANWRRWGLEFWPTAFLVDKQGRIRYRWEGELNYGNAGGEGTMTALIEKLLKE